MKVTPLLNRRLFPQVCAISVEPPEAVCEPVPFAQ